MKKLRLDKGAKLEVSAHRFDGSRVVIGQVTVWRASDEDDAVVAELSIRLDWLPTDGHMSVRVAEEKP